MSGQNKTFNATDTDGPAILRWNIKLELLILVVGGAARVFYWHARYLVVRNADFTSCLQHTTVDTNVWINTVGGASRSRPLVPLQGETHNFYTSDMDSTGILRTVWWQSLTDVSGRLLGPIFKGQERLWFLDPWRWDRHGGHPETSVMDYHHTLRNSTKEGTSHLLGGGSLKSHNFHICYKFKGGSGHTIADKFGEVIARGDFCTKLVLPFLLTNGTDNSLHNFSA